ncbi:MAG: hypothetical protein KF702_06840 [Gammaproteobacteria bacterium]|nr:hypothetical protein [Gammaproteobacteria bacterium]
MIKAIIRKTYLPIQVIFDAIRHQQAKRLMMSYTLKINTDQNCCALRNDVCIKIARAKQFNLPRTAMNGA